MTRITRRKTFLLGSAAMAILIATRNLRRPLQAQAADPKFEVTHSDAEWRKLLTVDQFAILRQSDTERPFTSPLLHEKRKGVFKGR